MNKIESAVALNKAGTAHFANKKYADAIEAYQAAIDMRPDYIDAYYNLGLALQKMGRLAVAWHAYTALIELSPNHLGGRFQLGCLCMERHNYEAAIAHFLAILQMYPEHVETQMNLAACLLLQGRLHEAKAWYRKVLVLCPEETSVLFNLGVICMQQGCVKEAVEFYLAAVAIDQHFHDALQNLGVAYLAIKDTRSALQYFRAALHVRPDNIPLQHTVSALTQDKQLSGASPAYIRSLFDAYANHYDAHLLEVLHYQVPQQLFALVQTHVAGLPLAGWEVLDLGCGTGLAGAVFKPFAKTLVGVDLSEKMLAAARQKQIYDELVALELLAFLQDKQSAYDLIVAADVLVYFGDLSLLFAAVAKVLKPGGLFVFNVEVGERADYAITDSGRFVHRMSYVQALADRVNLKLQLSEMAALRTQDGVAVSGRLYLLQRQS